MFPDESALALYHVSQHKSAKKFNIFDVSVALYHVSQHKSAKNFNIFDVSVSCTCE